MSVAEKDINTALSVRLKQIQVAGSPPVAWENAPYTPVENTLYLEETFIPNIKNQVGIENSSTDDYEGIYQVLIKDTRGARRFGAQEQAKLVAEHFPRGAEYTQNSVTVKITTVQIAQGLTDNNTYNVPVSIYWRALA
tara:strand:- start:7789 stop:8202 length:414 start_codon:yes stop_codon:yes gene_type:complete